MNEILKNLLVTIRNGGDGTGGGDKLRTTNTPDYDFKKNGGGGNDPTEPSKKEKAEITTLN